MLSRITLHSVSRHRCEREPARYAMAFTLRGWELTLTLAVTSLLSLVGCKSLSSDQPNVWTQDENPYAFSVDESTDTISAEQLDEPIAQVTYLEDIQAAAAAKADFEDQPTSPSDSAIYHEEVDQLDSGAPAANAPTVETLGSIESNLQNGDAVNLGMPVDLSWSLQTAAGNNPQVTFAQARISEANAKHTAANALWLPHLQFGSSIYTHYGQLQNAIGRVFDADRSALYAGFGARASGTGTPRFPGLTSQFHLGDAYFQPLIANRNTAARRHEAAATTNDVLLDTSIAYLELLSAKQLEAITIETRKRAEELVKLTTSFARVGQGAQADADRAQTELVSRVNEVEKAGELWLVASAKLSQQLSLDDRVLLMPIEQVAVPIDLVPEEMSRIDLIETGLSTRNELKGRRQLVAAACARLRREQTAAFVPNLGLAMSYGGFGGGFDEAAGDNFDDRLDVDAFAYWSIRNLGIGEKAARCEAAALLGQARANEVSLHDQIVREISAAHAKVEVRRRRIEITQEGLEWAANAYKRDVTRIREGEGFPIEALSSLNGLDKVKRDYLQAIIEFNQAQFELQRAIGWPGGKTNTPSLDGAATEVAL